MMTKKMFQSMVIDRMRALKLSPIDAVIEVCNKKGLDPIDAAKYIDGSLKERIKGEAIKLRMVATDELSAESFFEE